ncbi:hypothetical protein [Mycolicibacter hiberniae]|uniref:Uncharacterized protein n=1 Tax=Mycolicibacter hiberniae TaxID=29314 RepID=A0A7I7X1C3_9MYCO|nr:hypothetical protein [Mycolicibacter hiberniae]MCV7085623.1 hypothetical protein [Mycolicibacter hiberniae]ORV69389.1 hypothetical protein AWC09_13290 [Mycolicibacter hiberniae]BBZ22631.1 hypothetical protein MHIB_10490 [Mycolicibacter hiberniae]
MGSVSRHPRIAVGIAALAAGALVMPPSVAPPPPAVLRAVELVANPLDPYVDLVTNTFDNLVTIGGHWLEDPLPTVVQLVTNWFDYAQRTFEAFGATAQSFVDGLINLPGQLETLFDAISSSDITAALGQAIIIVISAFPVLGLVDRLMAIPIEIVGNIVSAAMATLHAVQVPVGLAALSSVQAAFTEVGTLARDFIDDLSSGDIAGALVGLIGAPAQLLDAFLNSESPGLAGLLAPFEDMNQSGFVDALVNYLPRAVAESIGAPYSPLAEPLIPDIADVALADPLLPDVADVALADPGDLLPEF